MDPVNIPAKFEVRSFIRSWDNRGYFKNLRSPWIRPRSIFSQNFKGLLFGWTIWIYLPNLKFVALSVPETRGYSKNGAVPVYAHPPFSPKFLIGFCSHGPSEYICKFEVRSFTRSWDNRGYSKKIPAVSGYAHAPFSRKIFHGLVFGWTLWMYQPNLQSVALAVPEIIVIAVLGCGCEPQSWVRGGRRGSGI